MRQQLLYLTLFIFSTPVVANEPATYGWNLPNTPLNIGGYLDMTYDEKRKDAFLFNDIAIMFSAHQNRWNLLGEVEFANISLDGKSSRGSGDVDMNLERLQLSYALSDEQTLQLGRFNSDIGYWNQAPIPILQDTITEPHIITHLFPKSTTGLLYRQQLNSENSFSFTLQHNPDIAHQDYVMSIDRHTAVAYQSVYDEFSWSLSGGFYREKDGMEATYFGMGAEYELEDFTLQGELFMQQSDEKEEKPYSGYLQSVWHFADRQGVVVRFEGYDDEVMDVAEETYLLGYIYRPWENVALKGEYIHHTQLPLNRFVYSLSVLF